jgi:UDP-N-acetylmuramyl pentapeptide phosphotransferase/UDP-N-acetylglucosamine-1-phosphate transferase
VWPRVPDQHKPGKPLIPNGLGVVYVLLAIIYLFVIDDFSKAASGVSAPFTLAICILFGGFIGLLDDWSDIKWRYKAVLPLVAALPLIYLAVQNNLATSIDLFGVYLQLGHAYYFVVIPLIVMVVTNTINMLGGLNGLETICPAVVLLGLAAISPPTAQIIMAGPLAIWLILAYFNFKGKIFVGNVGSFSIGMTVASFAVITNLKTALLTSIVPYVFNSAVILLTFFFVRKKAVVSVVEGKLVSDHRRSLITLLTYRRPLSERKVVMIISLIVAVFTALAILSGII